MATTSNSAVIPVVFNGGAYGNFVRWCLLHFSGQTDGITLPFTPTGSSHAPGFSEKKFPGVVLIHPKNTGDLHNDSILIERLESIVSQFGCAILLYANTDRFILNLNNKFEKIFEKGFLHQTESIDAEMANNLKQWGCNNLDEMQRWQVREFLSIFLWQQHLAETELENLLKFNHPQILKVDINNLIVDFENTIKSLLNFSNFKLIRSNFEEIHQAWLACQYHLNKDQLVSDIVDSVVHNKNLDWSEKNLTVVDEGIVQMKLRDLHRLDLLCYNLNEFPTNTIELRKLLIDV